MTEIMSTRAARCTLALAVLLATLLLVIGAPTAEARGKPTKPTTTQPRTPTNLIVTPSAAVVIPGCTPTVQCPTFRGFIAVAVRLTTTDGDPVVGRSVAVVVDPDPYSRRECRALTDATGTGRCTVDHWSLGPSPIKTSAHFAGDTEYEPSSASFGS